MITFFFIWSKTKSSFEVYFYWKVYFFTKVYKEPELAIFFSIRLRLPSPAKTRLTWSLFNFSAESIFDDSDWVEDASGEVLVVAWDVTASEVAASEVVTVDDSSGEALDASDPEPAITLTSVVLVVGEASDPSVSEDAMSGALVPGAVWADKNLESSVVLLVDDSVVLVEDDLDASAPKA